MAKNLARAQSTKHRERDSNHGGPNWLRLKEEDAMKTNPKFRNGSASLPLLIAITLFAMLAIAVQATAQQIATVNVPDPTTTQIKVKQAAIKPTPASSGQQMYVAYCAACHGATAKGDGPAASALKEKPADLTTLSIGNKGKFPGHTVEHVLTDVENLPAHGSTAMPNWYPAFRSLDKECPPLAGLRIHNLVSYLEKLQVSSAAADKALQANPR
jgi:mono/diheme cytochrome c family protein